MVALRMQMVSRFIHVSRTVSFTSGFPKLHSTSSTGAPLSCQDVKVPNSHSFSPHHLPWLAGLAQQHDLKTYEDFYKFSLQHNDVFWGTLARHVLHWRKPFHTVQNCDFKSGNIEWFSDRHAKTQPDKVALVWEHDEPGHENITYSELLKMTCKLANVLKDAGVQKGDRVCIYLSTSPMAVASMLACARIGAIHALTFAGFSAESLRERIKDCGAKVVITANETTRGGKTIPLKKIVDEAIKGCPSVLKVLVQQRTKTVPDMKKTDIPLNDALGSANSECTPVVLDSEDPLFLLYTSGSTGKPKGLVHSQAGYLLYAALTHKLVFNSEPGDVFGCLADIGWITGHSYVVYGPLANGGTTVLFDSTPTYPNPSRYWETVERLKINQLYVSPTALRLLLRYGNAGVEKHDRSSLKMLGVVGEPINHEAWEWYYDVVGEKRCPIVDTWWQTETGGICIAPLPAGKGDPIYPSMAMRPFFGIEPSIKNTEALVDHGADLAGGLCLARAWPGMARGVYGDKKRFVEAYFSQYPGYYFTGDGCVVTQDNYYRITGRIDDVINISGHRLGTAEVEDALDSHKGLAESAVISYPHGIKGEALAAFVVLREDYADGDHAATIKELKQLVKMQIASFAVPDEIIVCPGLPKTRSGKIMRRLLRKIASNEQKNLGDTSTLSDSNCLEPIVDLWSRTKTFSENEKKPQKGK